MINKITAFLWHINNWKVILDWKDRRHYGTTFKEPKEILTVMPKSKPDNCRINKLLQEGAETLVVSFFLFSQRLLRKLNRTRECHKVSVWDP